MGLAGVASPRNSTPLRDPSWNDTDRPYERDGTIVELFESVVDRRAGALAVADGDRRMNYGELDAAANRVAHELLARGVGPQALVGVAMDRSLETIAALIGILKAGGAYLPLDCSYPTERLALMLDDTRAPVVLAQPELVERLPPTSATIVTLDRDMSHVAARSPAPPPRHASAESLAYVMYTSGSTGRPKGVEVVHRGVLRLVRNSNYVELHDGVVVLQVGPLSFDPSTLEIWGPLLNGGTLAVYPAGRPDPGRIGEAIRRHGATVALLVSGLLHQIVDDDIGHLRGLRQLLTGGDVLSPEHARRVVSELPHCRLVNLYGPTESTLCATYHVVGALAPGESVPIGRPLANTRIHLLDEHRHHVAHGEIGQIFIGGDGLARGYLGDPQLTAERFVADHFSEDPGARLYRTGDLARLRADGELEFLGRSDDQVKIRGYRIEPSEVAAHVAAHPAVAQAAVIAREDVPGHKRLVAYIVGRAGASPGVATLQAFLKSRLPTHMLPSAYVALEQLPLTPTGKLDRSAFPRPEALRDGGEKRANAPPASELERQIAAVWQELLGVDDIQREDDFFELGGDSLLGTLALARLQETSDVAIPSR